MTGALLALAWALRQGDPSRAYALAEEARALAIERGDRLSRARAARIMAMSLSDPDALHRNLDLAEEARQEFDAAGDTVGRAGARDFLATIYEYIGDLSGGLELALDALALAREADDPIRVGYALSSVGGILTASGEPMTAIPHLEEALALFEAARDRMGVGTLLTRLSRALEAAGRQEDAFAVTARAKALASDQHDPWLLSSALAVEARIEANRGRWAEAEAGYREALGAIDQEAARKVLGSELQVELGRLLLQAGEPGRAEPELQDVLRRVEGDAISLKTETMAHEALAEVYEGAGDAARALKHLRAADRLKRQVAEREAKTKLAQMEARVQIQAAQKDAEFQRLRYVELENMQAELVESERMALLGKLAAGTAHELNTPLGVLRSSLDLSGSVTARLAQLCRSHPEVAGPAERLLQALEQSRLTSRGALDRLGAIAGSYRRFTELDQAERRAFDLRRGLEGALQLFVPTLPNDVQIEARLEPVPEITGWPRALNHAFLTVLQNAAQAIEVEGKVGVRTEADETEVRVVVEDDGRGMTEAEVAELFEVGFGTAGPRAKMRLGMSAARATVKKHGGTIEVKSAPGEGTTVTFHLPRS